MIELKKINESYFYINSFDNMVLDQISNEFTFYVKNFQYHPKYKKLDSNGRRRWDGKIRLFNKKTKLLYVGLFDLLTKYFDINKIEYIGDPKLYKKVEFSATEIENWIKSLNVPLEKYNHQLQLVQAALIENRLIAISPTSSGKSFALYLYIKYLLENYLKPTDKILLTVPVINLVEQMATDFEKYDENYGTITKKIHRIRGGFSKHSDKQIYISTWQSIYDMEQDYFEQFKVLIMDETHRFSSECTKMLAEKSINANFRLGVTGTLDDWKTNNIMLQGIIGKIVKIIKTSDLIKEKILTPLRIFNIIIGYSKNDRENIGHTKIYARELQYILDHPARLDLVVSTIIQLPHNSLVLFTRLDYGKKILQNLRDKTQKRLYYVDGETPVSEREQIRRDVELEKDCVLVASAQIFSTGVNIKNIHNVFLTSGGKSKIRLLQSIGRGLRLHKTKNVLTVIDFIDDLSLPSKNNFMLKHYHQRQNFYIQEGFPYQTREIKLS